MSFWIYICFCVQLWWLRVFYQTQKPGIKTDWIPNCSCLVEQWPCFRNGQPVALSAALGGKQVISSDASDRQEHRSAWTLIGLSTQLVSPERHARGWWPSTLCPALLSPCSSSSLNPPHGIPTLDPSACRQLTRNKSVHSNCHINYVPLCLFTFPPRRSRWCADILYAESTGW